MAYSVTNDDEFAAFAQRAEQEAQDQKNRNAGGAFAPKDYDPIKWVGLEEKAKIVRIVGGAPASMKPGSHVAPTDAHELFISKIMDDSGKRMKLKLPLHAEDPNHEHIMWRIINKVNEVEWVKGPDGKSTKKYKYENYDWFDKVNHGGFAPTDKSYQYSRGWKGQQVIVMNVIDREDKWCAENKHTKLLSKKISLGQDGQEFPEDGVPSYGFCAALSTIVSNYGSWERYDVQLRRTGQMQQPVEVKQATLYKKNNILQELDKDKVQYISLTETLTPEELEYERYDIGKFFAPTSYQKLLAKLGNTIKAIDADLNKNFYNELQALAEKEKAEYEAAHANDEATTAPMTESTSTPVDDPFSQPIPQAAPTAAPTRAPAARTAPVASGLSPDKIALLKGWDKMTQEEKDSVVDVITHPDGTLQEIVFKDGLTLLSCPETFPDGSAGCKINAPDFFHVCPSCGKEF